MHGLRVAGERVGLGGARPGGAVNRLSCVPVVPHVADDAVAAARIAVSYAKKNDSLVIVGGALGEDRLDVDGVKALAALLSLDESRGKLVGLIQTPATRVAGVIQAPAGQLARVLKAYSEKSEAA